MFAFACACGKQIEAQKDQAGQFVHCPACGRTVVIPPQIASAAKGKDTHVPPSRVTGRVEDALRQLPDDGATAALGLPRGRGAAPEETMACDRASEAADLASFLAPGQEAGELGRLGRYRILEVLGQGGMGAVFRADDPQLHRQVAVKVMLPALCASEQARQRFLREAQAAAALEHDNIVPIHQVGEDHGIPFIVMPLLRGDPLERRLSTGQPLPVALVIKVGREVAQALMAAHERGLIHRDIKPANIWLETATAQAEGREAHAINRVKLLDFGLARLAVVEEERSQSGSLIGTPGFMPPEQVDGLELDGRSDLFSLGCVLYQMTTGRPAFPGNTVLAKLRAVAVNNPDPPCQSNPAVPEELSRLILQLLARDRAERPADAREVLTRLRAIARTMDQPDATEADLPRYRVQPRPGRRRRWPLPAALVLLVIGGAWLLPQVIIRLRGPDGREKVIPVPDGHRVIVDKNGLQVAEVSAAGLPPWDLPPDAPSPALAPFAADQARQHQEAWAKYLKRERIEDNSIGMKLVLIPAGEYHLGYWPPSGIDASVAPIRNRVRIPRPFYLGLMEVTWEQFRQFVDETGYRTEVEVSGVGGRDSNRQADPNNTWRQPAANLKVLPREPVTQVTWNDAQAFCAWLSQKEGAVYRLPTEAEWEFACRAGSTSHYGVCDTAQQLPGFAWIANNRGPEPSPLRQVGLKQPNAFELHDILGNVAEYCGDLTSGSALPLTAQEQIGQFNHVVRGGSWAVAAARIHAGIRYLCPTSHAQINIGFRVLKQTTPEKPPAQEQPWLVTQGEPLSPFALVPRPAPIAGLRSWSIELITGAGGAHLVTGYPIAWSGDGKLLATGGWLGSVRLWDRQGRLVKVFPGHRGDLGTVAFSPDERLLVTGTGQPGGLEQTFRIWDVETAACRGIMVSYGTAPGAKFSPDGKQMALFNGSLGIMEVDRGKWRDAALPGGAQTNVIWSPDSQFLLSANVYENAVTVWNASTLKQITTMNLPGEKIKVSINNFIALDWSADGQLFAAGRYDGKVFVWDARTRELKQEFDTKAGPVRSLKWSKDNRRLFASGQAYTIWDALEGKELQRINSISGWLSWSPDEKEVAVNGVPFQIFDTATGVSKPIPPAAGSYAGHVGTLSLDGKVLVTGQGFDGAWNFWDADSGKLLYRWTDLPRGFMSLSPRGDLFAIHNARELWLLDVATGQNQRAVKPQPLDFTRVAWSPDGALLATGHKDAMIRIWNTAKSELLRELKGHEKPVFDLAWSPDGKQLASYSEDSTLRIWDPMASVQLGLYKEFVLPNHTSFHPCALAWSTDSQQLYIRWNTRVARLDVTAGKSITSGEIHYTSGITRLATAPNGRQLLIESGRVGLFDLDMKLNRWLPFLGQPALWLPDNRRLLGGMYYDFGFRGRDLERDQVLGILLPSISGNNWMCVGPEGHYRGSPKIDDHIVYVAQTEDGHHLTLTPAEFAKRFGWKNDPNKARLLQLDP